MSPSAAPPSPQEIQRKLSVHSVSMIKSANPTLGHVSGTESDSDSIQTPDVLTAPMGHSAFHVGTSVQPPLSSIAERRSGSGEDSDEEEEESGWKAPDIRSKPRNSADESVIKSGYLWKKGERRKTWKKRWFVLRPAHLAYYKSDAEYQLLRLLDLADIHSCTPVNLKRHNNTFGLISPNRTYYFQASDPEDVRQWVEAIEEARQTLLATSTQTSGGTPIPIVGVQDQPIFRGNLPLSSSPGQLHPITSSDSEDGGAPQPPPAVLQRGQSAPSPTAVNFLFPPPKPSSAVPSPSKTIVSGYLMKCGSKRRNWRKRWFVLTGEKLVYAGSHMDTKPNRVFPFSEILDALEYELPAGRHHHHNAGLAVPSSPPQTSPITEGDENAASHTFKIVTTKRTLLLCAPSEEDEIKWLGAIRALIVRRTGSGVVPGTSKSLSSGAHGNEHGAGSVNLALGSASASAASAAAAAIKSKTRRPSFGAATNGLGAGGSAVVEGDAREVKP